MRDVGWLRRRQLSRFASSQQALLGRGARLDLAYKAALATLGQSPTMPPDQRVVVNHLGFWDVLSSHANREAPSGCFALPRQVIGPPNSYFPRYRCIQESYCGKSFVRVRFAVMLPR